MLDSTKVQSNYFLWKRIDKDQFSLTSLLSKNVKNIFWSAQFIFYELQNKGCKNYFQSKTKGNREKELIMR